MLNALISLVLLLAPLSVAADASDASDADIVVNVERRGHLVIVDVDLPIEVRPEDAWPILTDYDHMTDVFPDLTESRVLSRVGNNLRVVQRGRARRGPLWFSFENTRDITLLPPNEIRTHLVSGTLEQADSVTHLVPTAGGMRLVNHGEYVPGAWIPVSIVAGLVESETRTQFGVMRAEILRRQGKVASFTR